jgi:serine phosphatase RsbU (regulator of sigma subunit)
MSITLKSKLFIVVFFSIICLKIEAQFLDKHYYLVDSIVSYTIPADDRKYLDEQMKIYKSSKSDTVKIQILSALVENLQDEKVWIKYNQLLYNNSKIKLKTEVDTSKRTYFIYKGSEALALNNFGYYYYNFSNNYDLAFDYYNKALNINLSINNFADLITCYSNIANYYQNRGDLNKALIYYQKSLALENKVPDKTMLLAPLNNVAQVYFYLNDTVKALQTLKRAFKISFKSDNNYLKGSLLHNIGSLTYFKGDKTGIQTLRKALAFREKIGDKKGVLQTNLSLAGIENNNKNYALCEKYLQDAGKLVGYFPNSSIEAMYYVQMGDYYSSLGNVKASIDYLEKSITIFKTNTENEDLYKTLSKLIDLYSLNNNKYALKKVEAYDLQMKVMKNIDKSKAQKLLLKQKFDEDLKINETKFKLEQELRDEKNKTERNKQKLILVAVSIILLAVILFSFFIYRALKINKQKSKIISEQKIEVENQKHLIEEKHKDITDSITYAHRIQSSLIPSQLELNKQIKNLAILFQPRDIVSGDFYWYSKLNKNHVFVLADCTGHGVPGAFMSFIGINQLNTIVNEKEISSPAQILNELKKGVVRSLNSNQSSSEKKDGMDVALISFNEKELVFSGANQSILIIREGQLIELKGNKQPIGLSENNEDFVEQTFPLNAKDRIVLFSDGVVDQFGGDNGKKLKSRHFKAWLIETSYLSLHEQKASITEKLNAYKGTYEQTDDISLAIIEV